MNSNGPGISYSEASAKNKRQRQFEYAQALQEQIQSKKEMTRAATSIVDDDSHIQTGGSSSSSPVFPHIASASPSRRPHRPSVGFSPSKFAISMNSSPGRTFNTSDNSPYSPQHEVSLSSFNQLKFELEDLKKRNHALESRLMASHNSESSRISAIEARLVEKDRDDDQESTVLHRKHESQERLDALQHSILRLQNQVEGMECNTISQANRVHQVSDSLENRLIELEQTITHRLRSQMESQRIESIQDKEVTSAQQDTLYSKLDRNLNLRDSRILELEKEIQRERTSRIELQRHVEAQLQTRFETVDAVKAKIDQKLHKKQSDAAAYVESQLDSMANDINTVTENCESLVNSTKEGIMRSIQSNFQSNVTEVEKLQDSVASLEEVVRAEVTSRLSSADANESKFEKHLKMISALESSIVSGTGSRFELMQARIHEIDSEVSTALDSACSRWCQELKALSELQLSTSSALEELVWASSSRLEDDVTSCQVDTSMLKTQVERNAHSLLIVQESLKNDLTTSIELLGTELRTTINELRSIVNTDRGNTQTQLASLQKEFHDYMLKETANRLNQIKVLTSDTQNDIESLKNMLLEKITSEIHSTKALAASNLQQETTNRLRESSKQSDLFHSRLTAQEELLTSTIEDSCGAVRDEAFDRIREQHSLRLSNVRQLRTEASHAQEMLSIDITARTILQEMVSLISDTSVNDRFKIASTNLESTAMEITRHRQNDLSRLDSNLRHFVNDSITADSINSKQSRLEQKLALEKRIEALKTDTEVAQAMNNTLQKVESDAILSTINADRESITRNLTEVEIALQQSILHTAQNCNTKLLENVARIESTISENNSSMLQQTKQLSNRISSHRRLRDKVQGHNEEHIITVAQDVAISSATQSCVAYMVNYVSNLWDTELQELKTQQSIAKVHQSQSKASDEGNNRHKALLDSIAGSEKRIKTLESTTEATTAELKDHQVQLKSSGEEISKVSKVAEATSTEVKSFKEEVLKTNDANTKQFDSLIKDVLDNNAAHKTEIDSVKETVKSNQTEALERQNEFKKSVEEIKTKHQEAYETSQKDIETKFTSFRASVDESVTTKLAALDAECIKRSGKTVPSSEIKESSSKEKPKVEETPESKTDDTNPKKAESEKDEPKKVDTDTAKPEEATDDEPKKAEADSKKD